MMILWSCILHLLAILYSTNAAGNPDVNPDVKRIIKANEVEEYWLRTLDVLDQAVQVPVCTDGIIVGNFRLIPRETRLQINYLFDLCRKFKMPLDEFHYMQPSVILVILNWKRFHDKADLDKNMADIIKKVEKRSYYVNPEGTELPNYTSIGEKVLADYFGELPPDFKPSACFDDIIGDIRKMPNKIRWRIGVLRAAVCNGYDEEFINYFKGKLSESMKAYLLTRNYFEITYDVTEILTKLTTAYGSSYENGLYSKALGVSIKSKITFISLKGCKYPDMLEIGQGLDEYIQTPLENLHRCLGEKEAQISQDIIKATYVTVLLEMLAYTEGKPKSELMTIIENNLNACKSAGSTMNVHYSSAPAYSQTVNSSNITNWAEEVEFEAGSSAHN